MDKEVVTTAEAARILGVSRPTVIRLVKRGELDAYRLTPGKTSALRISRESINALIERRRK